MKNAKFAGLALCGGLVLLLAACGAPAPQKSSGGGRAQPRLTDAEVRSCLADQRANGKVQVSRAPQADGSSIVEVAPMPGATTTQVQVDAVTDCISRAAEK